MTQRGYPLDMLSPVRYVATAIEDAASAGRILGASDLLRDYTHPMSADLTRVARNEHTEAPKAIILKWALAELGNQVSFNRVKGYTLTVPFEDLRYEGSPVYRFTGDDPRIEEQRRQDRQAMWSPDGTEDPPRALADDDLWEYIQKHWRRYPGGRLSLPAMSGATGFSVDQLRRVIDKRTGGSRRTKMDRTAAYVLHKHFEPHEVAEEISNRKDREQVYSFLMEVLEMLAPVIHEKARQQNPE